jgi:hypothetical protein
VKSILKKVKFYLQHVDGIWSVPMAFLAFWFGGILLQYLGGFGVGTYDPGFIQPFFLAVAIVIGATNAAVGGLFFTFRGLYRYLYGEKKNEKDKNGNETEKIIRINYSKIDWLKLKAWQRFVLAFCVFFYYVSAVIVVYLYLV